MKKFRLIIRCFLGFLILFTGWNLYLCLKILANLDVSETARYQNDSVKEGIYLISFASPAKTSFDPKYEDIYFRNQNALTFSALNKGIDFFYNYTPKHLDKEFLEANKEIMAEPHGYGYWLWKPYLILKTLQETPENSIIIYADAGFTIKQPLTSLIELAAKHGMVLIDWDDINEDIEVVTQRSALHATDCEDESCRQGKHLWAAFGIYKNTKETREFVKHWYNLCQIKEALVNTESNLPNFPKYRYHIHDEALLSITNFKLPNTPKYLMTAKDLKNYTNWHRRKAALANNQRSSLIPEILRKETKILSGFERDYYSSKPLSWLRSKLYKQKQN